jgi:hypothetical protein
MQGTKAGNPERRLPAGDTAVIACNAIGEIHRLPADSAKGEVKGVISNRTCPVSRVTKTRPSGIQRC